MFITLRFTLAAGGGMERLRTPCMFGFVNTFTETDLTR